MLGGDGDRAGLRFDGAAFGVGEARPALDDAHVGALQQAGDSGCEAIDDAVLPRDRAGEIKARRGADRDA